MSEKNDDLQTIGQKMMSLWQAYLAEGANMHSLGSLDAAKTDPAAWMELMRQFHHMAGNPFEPLLRKDQDQSHEHNKNASSPGAQAAATSSDGRDVLLFQLVGRLADVERRLADLESRTKTAVS